MRPKRPAAPIDRHVALDHRLDLDRRWGRWNGSTGCVTSRQLATSRPSVTPARNERRSQAGRPVVTVFGKASDFHIPPRSARRWSRLGRVPQGPRGGHLRRRALLERLQAQPASGCSRGMSSFRPGNVSFLFMKGSPSRSCRHPNPRGETDRYGRRGRPPGWPTVVGAGEVARLPRAERAALRARDTHERGSGRSRLGKRCPSACDRAPVQRPVGSFVWSSTPQAPQGSHQPVSGLSGLDAPPLVRVRTSMCESARRSASGNPRLHESRATCESRRAARVWLAPCTASAAGGYA